MGIIFRNSKGRKKGWNFSISSKGVNLSGTIDLGLAKINIPLIGRRKKKLTTIKGSGIFKKYW